MKRFIYLTLVLMIGFMLIGCATTTSGQRGEGSDLTTSVGNKTFVGESSAEARSFSEFIHGSAARGGY